MSNLNQSQQPVYVVRQVSPENEGAATTALWLEIIFGLFGLLGIGHVYSGRTALGAILLFVWWVYMIVATIVSALLLGLPACLFAPLYIAIPIISGIQARTYLKKTGGSGSWLSVGIAAGSGCLLIVIIVFALGGLTILLSILQNFTNNFNHY